MEVYRPFLQYTDFNRSPVYCLLSGRPRVKGHHSGHRSGGSGGGWVAAADIAVMTFGWARLARTCRPARENSNCDFLYFAHVTAAINTFCGNSGPFPGRNTRVGTPDTCIQAPSTQNPRLSKRKYPYSAQSVLHPQMLVSWCFESSQPQKNNIIMACPQML